MQLLRTYGRSAFGELMQKNLIIVECLSNYDWLNLKLLPHLRNEFDSRLLLIRGRPENSAAYQKLLSNDDEIYYLDDLESETTINNKEISTLIAENK